MKKNAILVCENCLSRNYHFKRNKFATKRMVCNKYCSTCKKTTKHYETK